MFSNVKCLSLKFNIAATYMTPASACDCVKSVIKVVEISNYDGVLAEFPVSMVILGI